MNIPHVIIIPGLGDTRSVERVTNIVKHWESNTLNVVIFDSQWHSSEPIEAKQDRLLELHDQTAAKSARVYVVGYSAGGALAVKLFSTRRKIHKLIVISAKLKGSNTIGKPFEQRAPAIVAAVKASERAIHELSTKEKVRITCYSPIFDGLIARRDMHIQGTRKKLILFIGHATSIGFALLFMVRRRLR